MQKEWLDQFEKAKKAKATQEHPKREALSVSEQHSLVPADSIDSSSNRKSYMNRFMLKGCKLFFNSDFGIILYS